jgi:hypothetical protein
MMKRTLLALPLLVSASCTTIYFDFYTYKAVGSTSTGGTGGGGGTTSTGGAGGALLCAPGATQPCYDGPPGTEGVGLCAAGMQTCAADGASWGVCAGEVVPQMEDCASGTDADCDGAVHPCMCGATQWAERFGDDQYQAGVEVAVDPSGDALLLGAFAGTLDFGGSTLASPSLAMFIAKLDPAGHYLWSRGFTNAEGYSLAVDGGGGVLVTGRLNGPVDFGGGTLPDAGGTFVAKFDAAANHVWSRSFPSTRSMAIAVDAAGNAIVTGWFQGSVDFGGGIVASNGALCTSPPCVSVFAVKLDAGGAHVWSHGYVGSDDFASPEGQGVAVDAAGNVVLSGTFIGALGFGGATFATNWKSAACASVAGCAGLFLVKLDPAGNHVWSQGFGLVDTHVGSVKAHGLAFDGAGKILLTGTFNGAVSFGGPTFTSTGETRVFLAKLDGSGAHAWSHDVTGNLHGDLAGVAMDSAGGFVLAGQFSGAVDLGGGVLTSAGKSDAFVARFDATGAHLCSMRFGDGEDQAAQGVALDSMGNMVLTGDMFGSTDFGSGTLSTAGGGDVFVASFSP